MKTMTYNLLKKIENAGGKVGASASTPATTTPKKGRTKKRKATPADEDDDEEATPVVKKKGRKGKKDVETAADCELCFELLRLRLRLTRLQLLLQTMPLSRASLPTRVRRRLLLDCSPLGDEQHILFEREPCSYWKSSIERTRSSSVFDMRSDKER
jgi:hypothetical protein